MPGALQGIKVVDFTQAAAMPSCCAILADWGAEVVKVEPPWGDWMRSLERELGTPISGKYDKGEVHFHFEFLNRSKKGIALNLTHERGREVIYKLIDNADIVDRQR